MKKTLMLSLALLTGCSSMTVSELRQSQPVIYAKSLKPYKAVASCIIKGLDDASYGLGTPPQNLLREYPEEIQINQNAPMGGTMDVVRIKAKNAGSLIVVQANREFQHVLGNRPVLVSKIIARCQ